MEMTIDDRDLAEMMESVFASAQQAGIASNDQVDVDHDLWQTLTKLGLTRLTGSEESGGSGGSWQDAASLLGIAAAAGIPVPLAENDLLAGWLLETAGQSSDERLRTAGLLNASGSAAHVPWASCAERVVLLWSDGSKWKVADTPATALRMTPGRNIAGEPRDRLNVDVDSLQGNAVPARTAEIFLLRGALARTLQMCGAMEKIVELCIVHATTRTQFGRPLAKFQAIQHLVADLACEASLARAAADAAVSHVVRLGWEDEKLPFAVAVAKSCTGHAASTVVRNAHQIHGAIGTTNEHDLHRYTKPVLSWRSEFGTVRAWDEILTRAAIKAGKKDAWGLIVDGRSMSPLLRELL